MQDEQQATTAIASYADTVRRICFVHLKDPHDVEDVFQDVFLKYVLRDEAFVDVAHEKAWIIRVTMNACKDSLRSALRKRTASLEELLDEPASGAEHDTEILQAVMALPKNYRIAVYLHYFEGYSANAIAGILKRPENTVYTWLSRARKQLKVSLGGE